MNFIVLWYFISAVRENLHRSGKLDKIKAELRAEIMTVLEPTCNPNTKPKIPSETLVINELIREFLAWHGYHYTTSVFITGKIQHFIQKFYIG